VPCPYSEERAQVQWRRPGGKRSMVEDISPRQAVI
jgi:hypothetical protein